MAGRSMGGRAVPVGGDANSGRSACSAQITTDCTASASPKSGSVGTPITSFIALSLNLGGSISSASLVTLLDQRESFHSTILGAETTIAHPVVVNAIAHGGIGRVAAIVGKESANLSYADTFFAIGGFAIVFAGLALALPARKKPKA